MATPGPDPYVVLGVGRDATDDDLDRAFRGLVRRLHPDTREPSAADVDADRRLQELLAAYARLRDPVRRAAYDRSRPASGTRPPTGTRAAAAGTSRRAEPDLRVGPVHWQPPSKPAN